MDQLHPSPHSSRTNLASSALYAGCVAAALLFLALTGCQKSAAPLRIGSNTWPGYEPFYLAKDLGLYPAGKIELLNFPSATEVMRAYRSRAIDVAAVTADEALQVAETDPDQRIILVCDFSKGADVILSRPEYKSLKDLAGRKVGVESGALGAYLLARGLSVAGMSAKELKVVPVPLNEHHAAYMSHRVEAVVTFEPERSRILAAGARQLFDSSQIPGEILDVLVTRSDFLDSKADSLRVLVSGWFKALEHLNRKPEASAEIMGRREQVTAQDFLASLRLLDLPSPAANAKLLGGGAGSISDSLRQLAQVMAENKLLAKTPDISGLPDPRFLPTSNR